MLSSMRYNDYPLKALFCTCPLRNDSCFIDYEHNQKDKDNKTLCLYIGVLHNFFPQVSSVSSRSALKRNFLCVQYRFIPLCLKPYVELAFSNASRVCLLGNTTRYAKSHAMSMMNVRINCMYPVLESKIFSNVPE